jgi:hypothetical protein
MNNAQHVLENLFKLKNIKYTMSEDCIYIHGYDSEAVKILENFGFSRNDWLSMTKGDTTVYFVYPNKGGIIMREINRLTSYELVAIYNTSTSTNSYNYTNESGNNLIFSRNVNWNHVAVKTDDNIECHKIKQLLKDMGLPNSIVKIGASAKGYARGTFNIVNLELVDETLFGIDFDEQASAINGL